MYERLGKSSLTPPSLEEQEKMSESLRRIDYSSSLCNGTSLMQGVRLGTEFSQQQSADRPLRTDCSELAMASLSTF